MMNKESEENQALCNEAVKQKIEALNRFLFDADPLGIIVCDEYEDEQEDEYYSLASEIYELYANNKISSTNLNALYHFMEEFFGDSYRERLEPIISKLFAKLS